MAAMVGMYIPTVARDDCSEGEQTLELEAAGREGERERERWIPLDTRDSMGLELQSSGDQIKSVHRECQ